MKFLKAGLILLYIATFAVMCRYTLKHSDYDLDILLYTACVMEKDYPDKQYLHTKIYHMALDELGDGKFKQYTDSTRKFRWELYKNHEKFMNMLPYYKAKGLYVSLLKLSYKMGYSPIKFSTYLNLVCYFLISILLLLLLMRHMNFYAAFVASYFALLMPTFTDTLKSNTPDLLTATFFLIAIFLLLQNMNYWYYLSILFFTLLVYTRSENILFVFTLSGLGLSFFKSNHPKNYFWILIIACLGTYFFNSNSIDGATWKELYKITNLPPEDIHSAAGQLSVKEYVLGFRRIPNNIFYCEVALIFLFSILPLLKFEKNSRTNVFYLLLISNLAFLVIRILLLPDISNRYFCGSFLLAVVCYFILNEPTKGEKMILT